MSRTEESDYGRSVVHFVPSDDTFPHIYSPACECCPECDGDNVIHQMVNGIPSEEEIDRVCDYLGIQLEEVSDQDQTWGEKFSLFAVPVVTFAILVYLLYLIGSGSLFAFFGLVALFAMTAIRSLIDAINEVFDRHEPRA